MSVYKRGPHWHVDIEHEGRRIRRSAGRGATRQEAIEYEAQIREELRRGAHGLAVRKSLDEAVARWFGTEAKGLRSYPQLARHLSRVRPYLRGRWLHEVVDVAEVMRGEMMRQGLKPATINRRLAILRRVANRAHKWGWLREPLGSRIEMLPEHNARQVYLTPEQVEALAQAAGEAGDALRLIAYTGLRRAEALSLTADNRQGDYLVLATHTKSGRPRTIPLPENVQHITLPLGLTDAVLRHRFEHARRAIGMPELHLHDLRHTYASLLIQAGVPVGLIQDLLGHTNPVTTRRYAHLAPEHLQQAVRRMAEYHRKK